MSASATDTTARALSETLRAFAELPSVSSASYTSRDASTVLLTTTQRDVDLNKTRKFVQTIVDHRRIGHPTEVRDAKLIAASPSGARTVVLRSENGTAPGSKAPKQSIEILDARGLAISSELSAEKVGTLCTSGPFGSVAWLHGERFVVFTADEPVPPQASFFDRDAPGKKPKPPQIGSQNTFRESWGERASSFHRVRLFAFDTQRDVTVMLPSPAADVSLGQAVSSQQGGDNSSPQQLAAVAWWEEPRRMGIYAYGTRPSAVYVVDAAAVVAICDKAADTRDQKRAGAQKDEENVEDESDASLGWRHLVGPTTGAVRHGVFSPRFLDESTLLVLESLGEEHLSAERALLVSLDASDSAEPKVLVDIPTLPKGDEFPGLYVADLPETPVLLNGNWVAMSTIWRSERAVALVNRASGKVVRIPAPPETPQQPGSYSLLDARDTGGSRMLVQWSSPGSVPRLYEITVGAAAGSSDAAASAKAASDTPAFRFTLLDAVCAGPTPATAPSAAASDFQSVVLSLTPEDLDADETPTGDFEAVLVFPKVKPATPQPLLVRLHGGPHSASIASFSFFESAFLAHGVALLSVNYRGSLGFGVESLRALPGRCGTRDVADVMQALRAALAHADANLDAGRVAVAGGSHGGFLTTHLVGQHPDVFCAGATRNPVVNVAAMHFITDIPDWTLWESGAGVWSPGHVPTDAQMAAMMAASPLRHVGKVKAPLLLQLGLKDLRVPPGPCFDYYRSLVARGVKAKLATYEDSDHALAGSVASELDACINQLVWILGEMGVVAAEEL